MSKKELKQRIFELDFAIYELVLYLDTHPTCRKGMELLKEYRKRKEELTKMCDEKYGKMVITHTDAPADRCWEWLESPWPWDNNFMEG